MAGSSPRCSLVVVLLLLISAVPLAIIVALERTKSYTRSIEYRSGGWFRECAKWDELGRRFLVSTMLDAGIAQIAVTEHPQQPGSAAIMEERTVLVDADMAGNGTFGILVDRPRGRLLVVYADVSRMRYGAIGAYDLATWDRIFLTDLSDESGSEESFSDDVTVDGDGNAYITDAKANKISKVSPSGELLSVIRSQVFQQRKEWYYNLVGLNGIVYHPSGYLLVIHTTSGHLFKIDIENEEVTVVKVIGGSLLLGDGLELLSPTKLVVAGTPSGRVVESSDNWETATLTGRYLGPMHRIASSATVMDGRVYLNHIIGGGLTKRTHIIAEAVFSPLNAK